MLARAARPPGDCRPVQERGGEHAVCCVVRLSNGRIGYLTDEFRLCPRSYWYCHRDDGGVAQEVLMARQRRLEQVFGATGDVPATRTVPDLEAALGLVRRLGGSIVSETRTAPGIGSWAFVSDSDGSEFLLWQSSLSVRG
jgi:predicted enzyme related to lactoylglutathione lyase